MKLVGHTMATPDVPVLQAIDLFSDIGLDGIEIRCGEPRGVVSIGNKTYPVEPFSPEWKNGTFSLEMGGEEFARIKARARERSLEIKTLTPYMWDINCLDRERARENIEGLKAYVSLASRLGADYVRVLTGREMKGRKWGNGWRNTVLALQELGDHAQSHGITLVVENHSGTMTLTGKDTARMIEDVDRGNVRILLDVANILISSDESWEEALEIQRNSIEYLHVKDFSMINGEQHPRIVGKGQVPWDKILNRLIEYGFDGCLSLEYERRWHPDELPPAEEGVRESKEYIQRILSQLQGVQRK